MAATEDFHKSDTPFINGVLVNLRVPDVEVDILQGQWHNWFNDKNITEYLEHGLFPVSRQEQVAIIKNEMQKTSSLLLAVDNRKTGKHIGVISLKAINNVQRKAEIAIVMGFDSVPGAALEAMALMTEHAFDRLNLSKLYAGQHESLWKWVNTLAMIGYEVEGFRENWGYRNGKPWGAIISGISAHNFYSLRTIRDGDILQGDPLKLATKRSKFNFIKQLRENLKDINAVLVEK